jgi:hypothetical protein
MSSATIRGLDFVGVDYGIKFGFVQYCEFAGIFEAISFHIMRERLIAYCRGGRRPPYCADLVVRQCLRASG